MRQYNIVSDLVLVKAIEPIVYKQFDNGDTLEVELYQDNAKINLTTETVLAFFQLEDVNQTVIQKTCTISNGNAIATLDNNILSVSGKVKVEFTIYDGQKETTTRTLLITVESSINRNEAIETAPQWDIVSQILYEGQSIISDAQQAATDANAAATNANTRASEAQTAANNATLAATNANTATDDANLATTAANNAADYANAQGDRIEDIIDDILAGPVVSVNGQTGVVELTATDVGAATQQAVDDIEDALVNKADKTEVLLLNGNNAMTGKIKFANNQGIDVPNPAGSTINLFDNTETTSGVAAAKIFANTNTTGIKDFAIKKGDGTDTNAFLVRNGEIYIINGTVARITAGSGSPEGAVTAPVGSIFLRVDGAASTTLYVKESGTGNTGWKAVQTA